MLSHRNLIFHSFIKNILLKHLKSLIIQMVYLKIENIYFYLKTDKTVISKFD